MSASHASGARTDSVFERARDKVAIADYLAGHSVKLARAGQDLRGPCVLCDSGTTKFRVMAKHGLAKWRCYDCDRHGDVVDLVAAHRRVEPFDAARWLLGEDVPVSAPRERRAQAPAGPSPSDKVALELWRDGQPFEGTLASRYLLRRGIASELLALAAPNLRYHAAAKHHWDPEAGDWVRAPAMLARVVTAGPDGQPLPTGGVHATYLDRETAGKAQLVGRDGKPAAKLMWGPQHRDGKPGGAWLIGPAGGRLLGQGQPLVNAEGIETALSIATLERRRGRWMRVCAALSLNRLQGGQLRDEDGCIDPRRPIPDPDAPAFSWPNPPDDPWPEVLIGVDADMSDVKRLARTGRGKPVEVRLTADVRKRICGHLAVAAWKAAGAPHARAIAPPPGLDFNDQLRRLLALECKA